MTIDDYFKSTVGKKIDYDGVFQNQCVDYIKDYADKVLGLIPEAVGNAWEYWTKYESEPYLYKNFTRIRNTPDFIPKKGDIGVFNRNFGTYGHVCICTGEGNINEFYSYDQNSGGNLEPVQKCKHHYVSFDGVLRPKTREDKKSYLVQITCDVLRVRDYPSTNAKINTRVYKNQVYTIVDEFSGGGYVWGKLKSGAGWIALSYTKKI